MNTTLNTGVTTSTDVSIISMVRKHYPALIAQQICGVQPMSTDTGIIFKPGYRPEPPKYKFSRAKWYMVKFNWHESEEVYEWCTQRFGPHPKKPDVWSRWKVHYGDQIQFRDEKDYVMFVLRWA